MRIVKSYPPNIAKIRAALGNRFMAAHGQRAFYCYGDTIYNPGGGDLTRADIAHEHTHSRRQGDNPEAWWDQWLSDMEFRVLEELIAHRVEYRVATKDANRHQRRAALAAIAGRLAGPLYGHAMNIATAKRLIGEESSQVTAQDILNIPRGRGLSYACIPPGTVIPDVPRNMSYANVGDPGVSCYQCGANAPMPQKMCRDPACPHIVREIGVAA